MYDAEKDPNYQAYRILEEAGGLKEYEGQWVAFANGEFVTHDSDKGSLLEKVRDMDTGVFVHQVLKEGENEPVIHLRSPRRA